MEIQVKAQAVTWQGRTMYRSYYLARNGRWNRFGSYEAPTPEVLKAQVMRNHRGSATIVWKD